MTRIARWIVVFVFIVFSVGALHEYSMVPLYIVNVVVDDYSDPLPREVE